MGRNRMIKAEFCVSETVNACSREARLLFVLMWLHCDDYGNHPAQLMRLKNACFPSDDLARDEMSSMMQELLDQGLVIEYCGGDGKRYWHVAGWDEHQKVDHPSRPRCPKYHAKNADKLAKVSRGSREGSRESREGSRGVSTSQKDEETMKCEILEENDILARAREGSRESREGSRRNRIEENRREENTREQSFGLLCTQVESAKCAKQSEDGKSGEHDSEEILAAPPSECDDDLAAATPLVEAPCDEHARETESTLTAFVFPIRHPKADRRQWILSQSHLANLRETFADSGIDVEHELRKAMRWCVDNTRKRKTSAGMLRFLTSWLGRASDERARKASINGHGDGRGSLKGSAWEDFGK